MGGKSDERGVSLDIYGLRILGALQITIVLSKLIHSIGDVSAYLSLSVPS